MNKFLFATSALIGAATLSAVASAGGMPEGGAARTTSQSVAPGVAVTLGGFIDFQAGLTDQDSAFETGANSREGKVQNDTEIHVHVDGQADNGLKYGAVVELEADVNADADGEGGNADKTYIYLESSAGRVELGNNSGAQDALKVDASTIARATGGVDGDWYDFVNTGGLLGTSSFIIRPDLPAAHARGVREDATKVTYYTPRFSGAQLGVSYTPDEGDGGTAAGFTGELNGNNENVFGLAANYGGEFNGVGVQVSATGEFGESEVATKQDVSAYALGTVLSYQGFSVAGSWGDWDDSDLGVGAGSDQNYWTLGAAYETGPFGVSATYLSSEADAPATPSNNEFTNLVVGADYQLAPGLVPYVEVSFFDLDQAGTTIDNDGTVVLLGSQLNF